MNGLEALKILKKVHLGFYYGHENETMYPALYLLIQEELEVLNSFLKCAFFDNGEINFEPNKKEDYKKVANYLFEKGRL